MFYKNNYMAFDEFTVINTCPGEKQEKVGIVTNYQWDISQTYFIPQPASRN